MYPKILKKLIEDLEKLPGIGEKTAERLALYLATTTEDEDILSFSAHLAKLKSEIKTCKVCHMITDQDICEICSNPLRDHDQLMVVSDAKDVFALEKMKSYTGVYHVLGGLIDFSRGITDKDLNIESLENRVKDMKEMIIATNGTVEGEMTAKYLKSLFESPNLNITRLAYGLPVGADLKYADELTLAKAVENRKPY
ncbi:MAG: recombination mediator RecR [Acholeplasmataceae bacterium]|nr:recombination mediator RecR [Acholeplasmataceae bacterium]MDD4193864.1 recombination mediator RecR [Acholeplasmataceae bacterium]